MLLLKCHMKLYDIIYWKKANSLPTPINWLKSGWLKPDCSSLTTVHQRTSLVMTVNYHATRSITTWDNVDSNSRTSCCIGTSGKLNHSRRYTKSIFSWTMSETVIREWSSLQMMFFNARALISNKEWPAVCQKNKVLSWAETLEQSFSWSTANGS